MFYLKKNVNDPQFILHISVNIITQNALITYLHNLFI